MPTTFKLLLKSFFYLLSCIFQIGYFIFNHLYIDIFCDQKCILFHLDLHITEFDICWNLEVSWYPVFRYSGSNLFLIISFGLFFLIILLSCHLNFNKYATYDFFLISRLKKKIWYKARKNKIFSWKVI